MEKFIQFHLEELQSQQETRHLVVELSSRITDHQSRVRQVLCSEPLRHPEVAPLVLVGMAADQPLERNFFPGLLEELLGRLGIAAPGESKPPTSSQEGAGHLWSSAVHEAISQIEQREVETPGSARLPQCLDLHYEEDFLEKQSHQVPAVFLDPLFIPSMANVVYKAFKPPVLLKAFPSASSRKVPSISSQPEDGGPEPEVSELKESTPSTSKTSQWVQEQVTKASNTDSDKTDEPTPEKEQPPQGLKVKIFHRLRKRGNKAAMSSSKDGATPSKVPKELEADDAETTVLTGPSEAALRTAQFELYDKDLPEVKEVHARILSLQEGEEATQEDFDSLPDFRLRWVVDETCPPTVIGEYWIDHLDSEGRLAKCKPNDFKYEDEWLPLYTRGTPDMLFQYEWECVIHQLHKAECLAWMFVYYDNNQRQQIAFCPYCGVMNKNSATAYSHVRKHLGIIFLCGSCYGKLYKVLQHLFHHMKTCRPCIMNRPEGS